MCFYALISPKPLSPNAREHIFIVLIKMNRFEDFKRESGRCPRELQNPEMGKRVPESTGVTELIPGSLIDAWPLCWVRGGGGEAKGSRKGTSLLVNLFSHRKKKEE